MIKKNNRKIKRGDIYWINLDPAIGSEVQKTRPGVIVSNNIQNEVSSRIIVVPITSNINHIYPFELEISVMAKPAKAMADQLRSLDKQRLQAFIGQLTKPELISLEKVLKLVLSLE